MQNADSRSSKTNVAVSNPMTEIKIMTPLLTTLVPFLHPFCIRRILLVIPEVQHPTFSCIQENDTIKN